MLFDDSSPDGRDITADEKATDDFVTHMLEKLRTMYIECGGNFQPHASILCRQDPSVNPPQRFEVPKLLTLALDEDGNFEHFMGVVSGVAATSRSASVFFTIKGWIEDRPDGKHGHWCDCHKQGKDVLLCYYEHESFPRQHWYAEVGGEPPNSITIGNWQKLKFPGYITIAFNRAN